MKPVFEENKSLLFYPVQYEGLEQSPYIFYTGATTNQQIVPGLDYLKEQGKKSLYLVGSDYVFPRTANKIIKAYAEANGIEILGEDYAPLGSTEFSHHRQQGQGRRGRTPCSTPSTATATWPSSSEYANVGLNRRRHAGGLGVDRRGGGQAASASQYLAGQLTAWNYYQTIDAPANKKFVNAYKAKYGADKPTSDPMEAAYTSVYLWKAMVEKANSFAAKDIQAPRTASPSTPRRAWSPSTAPTSTSPRPPASVRSAPTA